MCGLFLCEIIKGFHHYAIILIFLSCFGIYSDLKDLRITAPQGLPTMLSISCKP